MKPIHSIVFITLIITVFSCGKKIQEDITDFNENIKINLSNLQSGVYYLKVRTKNDIYTKKLILQ